jgi:hypothetical protein
MDNSDADFARRVETCAWGEAPFRHRDHVRLAWIYVRSLGPDAAEARILESILRFARSANQAGKFHDTMTRAWLRLVAWAVAIGPHVDEFDAFAAAHGWLLDARTLDAFYSAARLQSAEARAGWIEPDLRPLPQF